MKTRILFVVLASLLALLVVACSGSNSAPVGDIHCTEVDPHPVAQGIARKFDVTYEQVMTWFCGGHSFDDILLALQTAELVDRPAGELLIMEENSSWDQLWEELGLVSQPPG
jgi:hypothetical protein